MGFGTLGSWQDWGGGIVDFGVDLGPFGSATEAGWSASTGHSGGGSFNTGGAAGEADAPGGSATGGAGGIQPKVGVDMNGRPVYRPWPGQTATIQFRGYPIRVEWRSGVLVFIWRHPNGTNIVRRHPEELNAYINAEAGASGLMNSLFGKPWATVQNLLPWTPQWKEMYNRLQARYRHNPNAWRRINDWVNRTAAQWHNNHPTASKVIAQAAGTRIWQDAERRQW